MLPFLKNKKEASVSMEVEPMKREPDEGSDYGMLDAVCSDMLEAIQRKDKGLLKSALEALVEHIQDVDREEDKNLINEEN